jgi:hypothetical protein
VPNNLTASVKSADECSKIERAAFHSLVLQSGEVQSEGLPARVARAEALLFLLDASFGLIGISALKHPDNEYRQKVFAAANTNSVAASFTLELGWIYLIQQHRDRHLSSWLIDPLLDIASDRSVFATCRINNSAMNKILPKHGFQLSGDPYPSANGQYELNLFIRA